MYKNMFFRIMINWWVLVLLVEKIGSISIITVENLDESIQIPTDKGIVQGRKDVTYNFKEYWAFKGIPYARPPIGNLRFRKPKPAESWQGVLDATKEGSSCVETFIRGTLITVNGSEDCLFINVYTPQNPNTITESLPVLVWMYGGAFIEGNSSTRQYGPDFLLEQNIIIVTFNYRVGLFGFLSTEDTASVGNYGLKDQNLALRWVQTNIKNFGGDRNRVTISGQSAGAASVLYHLASPKSRGLFHRAIANSGSSLCTFAYQRYSRDIAFQVGDAVGITARNSMELVSKLRKINVEKLNLASRSIVFLGLVRLTQLGFPFSPTIEPNHKDAFITESTFSLFERGNFNKVPVLMGINSLESIFFANFIDLIKPIGVVYDVSPGSFANPSMNIKTFEQRREVGKAIKRHYFKHQSFPGATDDELLNYINDDQFVRPMRKTVQLICKYTPVYFYIFSYQSSYGVKGFDTYIRGSEKGVSHAEELTYIWKTEKRPPPKGNDQLIVLKMVKLWSNFVKTGRPTPVKEELLQDVTWPAVESPRRITYLQIDKNLSLRQNFREDHMQFWDKLYDIYGSKPYVIY